MKKINQGILKFLATYKFATYELLIYAGVYKHKTHLSSSMSRMVKAGQVKKLNKTEEINDVFYLSPKGANWVEQTMEIPANYPKHNVEIMPDQMIHHLHCIKRLIDFKSEFTVPLSASYLDNGYQDNNGLIKKKTDINGVESDLILGIENGRRIEYFLYEYENKKSVKEIMGKLETHKKLMGSGEVQKELGFEGEERGYHMLLEVENKANLGRVMKKFGEDPVFQKLKSNFLFYVNEHWCEYDKRAVLLV